MARGIPVQLNSDEDVYLARVQEALGGRLGQVAEAMVGDSALHGSQFALLEQIIGTVFRFTGWNAPAVLQFMDSVVGFAVFLLLYLFFRGCGFARWVSLAGAALFVVAHLAGLSRPIHQGGSFSVALAALCALQRGVGGRKGLLALSGALMGLLVGIYVWAWTYVWLWWGLLFVFEAVCWFAAWRQEQSGGEHRARTLRLIVAGLIGVLAALPFLYQLWVLGQHPLYDLAVFRSGMHPGRAPESWVYSALFLTMAGGVLAAQWRHPARLAPHRFAVITVLTATIAIHQQVVHGIIFNFVSHYLYGLLTAAIGVLLLTWTLRLRTLLIAGVAAAVYVSALTYDGRWVVSQFMPVPERFSEQHFATLLPVLNAMPRVRILSDADTSAFIAGSTRHDIVYSVYLKNVLIPHDEIAERYCLTQTALSPELRHIAEQEHLVYPDAVSVFKNDTSVREREVAMVEAACAAIDHIPKVALERYGVDYVLWDEQRQPAWSLNRLGVPLINEAQGEGWSLWEIKQ